jgi:hypothetical protein
MGDPEAEKGQPSDHGQNNNAAMILDDNKTDGLDADKVEKDRKKRTKKDGANSPSLGSAESREDSVRSQ